MAEDENEESDGGLKQLATEIAELGGIQEEEAVREEKSLLKGALDAVNTLAKVISGGRAELKSGGQPELALAKGGEKTTAPGSHDDDYDEEADDDDYDDPGYQDMEMGDTLDITDTVVRLEKGVKSMRRELKEARQENRKLMGAVLTLQKAVQASREFQIDALEANAALVGPLIKSQAKLSAQLADHMVEQPMAFGSNGAPIRATRAHVVPAKAEDKIDPDPMRARMALVKANGQRVISDMQVQNYQRHGRFHTDDVENQAIVAAVRGVLT